MSSSDPRAASPARHPWFASRRTLGVVLAAAAFLAPAGAGRAQTNDPVRDFGGGFRKFYQLGLPEASGGVYGKIDVDWLGESSRNDLDCLYPGALSEYGVQGNGWKLKELGGGTNRYLVGGVMVIDAVDQKTYINWVNRPDRSVTTGGAEFCVDVWKPKDLAKDVARVLSKLEQPGQEMDEESGGRLLLLAAHLYRGGMTNEANRLAGKVFELCPNGKAILQVAVTALADAQYWRVYSGFCAERNWAKWHEGLTGLLARFTSGWERAAAVASLAELVKARAAGTPPDPQREGLSDEDRALAMRLAQEMPEQRGETDGNTCWILPRPAVPGSRSATSNVLEAVKARGVKSVPLLISLLKDNTLVQPGMGASLDGHADVDEDAKTDLFRLIRLRPLTRGELARALLRPVLLLEEKQRHQVDQMETEDFAAECETWYKEHRNKPDVELAKVYLEKGDDVQRQEALAFLMRKEHLEANHAEIERILLEIARASHDEPYILMTYVAKRRAKAAGLVEQVAGIMIGTNAPAVGPGVRGNQGRQSFGGMAGQRLQQFIGQLRGLVSVHSVRERTEAFLADTSGTPECYQNLSAQLSYEDRVQSLDTLVAAIGRSRDPRKQILLMGLAGSLRNLYLASEEEEGEEPPAQSAAGTGSNVFDVAKHAAFWMPFVTNSSPDRRSVRKAAAWAVVDLYDPQAAESPAAPGGGAGCEIACPDEPGDMGWRNEFMLLVSRLGDRGEQFLFDRALALLERREAPALPGEVSAEDCDRMLKTLLAAQEVGAELEKLTLGQQLALREIAATNKALNAKLRPVADRITEVRLDPGFKSTEGFAARLRGRSFDVDAVKILLAAAQALSGGGREFVLDLSRRGNLAGMRVALTAGPAQYENVFAATAPPATNAGPVEITGVAGTVRGGARSTTAWWPVAGNQPGGRAESPDPAAGGAAETVLLDRMQAEMTELVRRAAKSEQDQFWSELSSVIEKVGAYAPAGVRFEGRGTGTADGQP